MVNKSDQINELATALSKAQSQMLGAVKDSQNPFFKSKYADLESIWEAIREPLTKNGLSVTQISVIEDGKPCLVTMLLHSSGQWLSGIFPLKPVKDDPQGMGSCISYIRRYTLASMTGVVQVDDDAEAAQGRSKVTAPPPQKSQPTTPVQKLNKMVKEGVVKETPFGYSDPLENEDIPDKPAPKPLSRFEAHKASQLGDYVAKIGKANGGVYGKALKNIDRATLVSMIDWLESDSKTKGRPIGDLAQEFISNATDFLMGGDQPPML